jgi:hypothetical protein
LDSSGSGYGPVAGSFEHGSKKGKNNEMKGERKSENMKGRRTKIVNEGKSKERKKGRQRE